MSATVWLLWVINLLLDVGGQIAFKTAASTGPADQGMAHWRHMAARPWIWIGIGCYVPCLFVWMAFLSMVPLSLGVLMSSINIVALMMAGRVLFGEALTGSRVTAILLICMGVAVVGSSL
jgi:multidrug transporter EmrE-like cation transporter